MDRIFTSIEQTFGALTLRIAVALFVLYFLGEGFSKLLLTIRDFSSGRRKLEHERRILEVLKLRCDIEALKRTHALDYIELPGLEPSNFEPTVKKTAAPLARSFFDFLATLGTSGTMLLLLLSFVLQFISVTATLGLGYGLFTVLKDGGASARDDIGFVIAGFIAVIATTGYLGFYLLRRRLVRRAPRMSIGATVLAVGLAIGFVIYDLFF